MSKKIIAANWKMNPQNEKEAIALAKSTDLKGAIIAPPFVYLSAVKKILRRASLAAQDIAPDFQGSYTGEISPQMLKDLGVKYVIIGHSERRRMGESDELINRKIKMALKYHITPIVCVGETHRDSGMNYLHFVKKQIHETFQGLPASALRKVIIAYEPVWAIGKNAIREATPEESQEMAIFIRKVLSDMSSAKTMKNIKILYGGSADEKNAEAFLTCGGVDGLLVGRASLDPKKFNMISSVS